jgi:hypothetical protein
MTRSALVLLILAILTRGAAAESVPLPPKLDNAVLRGLDFLAKQQLLDGSFTPQRPATTTTTTTTTTGTTAPTTAPVVQQTPVATTALVVAAMLSAGNPPEVGKHGLVVRNAIDFLVRNVPADTSRMTDQGVVAFALAEAYGVEDDHDERIKIGAAVTKLLKVILAAQSVEKSEVHAGGWGATPDARDSNLADTAWNVLAVRACRDAGFNVPPDAFARATKYVLRCRNPLDKGFAYQPAGQGNADATGIAITSLYALEAGGAHELPPAQNFLAQVGPRPPTRIPYRTMFHAVQGGVFAGDATFAAVSRPIFDALLKAQSPADGGWPQSASPVEEPGLVTATALATLTLTVPYRLLPLYTK